MTTHETLLLHKQKCESELEVVTQRIDEAQEALAMLDKHGIAIMAQIELLDELMDVENNPPTVELPFSGPDKIEEEFNRRLETHDGSSDAEVFEKRQDGVYTSEAMETVDTLDELNREDESN